MGFLCSIFLGIISIVTVSHAFHKVIQSDIEGNPPLVAELSSADPMDELFPSESNCRDYWKSDRKTE
jgi:hypothetical protein